MTSTDPTSAKLTNVESAYRGLAPIVCCVDDRYVLPLCVLMESLAAVPEHTGLRMLLLHQNLSRAGRV